MARWMRSTPFLRRLRESWTLTTSPLLAYQQLPTWDSEGLLEQEKDGPVLPIRERWRTIRHTRARRYIAFVGVAVSLLLLLALAFSKRALTRPIDPVEVNAQTLHLLIPSPNLNIELCKTTLSAQVLQYSPPTILRWDPVGNDVQANAQRRMTAVRDYLQKLAKRNGNDTVILMDSISTWFQLRPEVLLRRYYNINRSADKRLTSDIGTEAMAQQGFQQSIVFPAASSCSAASTTDRGCQAIPVSPLSQGTSGITLPRYLGQGVVVGPAKDMFELYRRAVAIIERSQDVDNELQIFTEIFGQQEYRRSLLRREPQSWLQRFTASFSRENHEPEPQRDNPDEFSIGLDYAGELSLSTETGPESFTWSHHSRIPPDITSSMPPFWSPSGQGLPSEKFWTDLRLLTNAHTQSIPAMIRHNTSASHNLRQNHWENLWMQPYSRQLLNTHMTIPTMPLAGVRDNNNVEQVFWSTVIGEKAGAQVADGPWMGWDSLCPGEKLASEVFGDDRGEWKNPLL
ncbi:hypothetical protein Q7P37_004055 [Cladosporium fusiforme]